MSWRHCDVVGRHIGEKKELVCYTALSMAFHVLYYSMCVCLFFKFQGNL